MRYRTRRYPGPQNRTGVYFNRGFAIINHDVKLTRRRPKPGVLSGSLPGPLARQVCDAMPGCAGYTCKHSEDLARPVCFSYQDYHVLP